MCHTFAAPKPGNPSKAAISFTQVGWLYTWKAKCPIFKAKVAGFRGKVASKKIGHLAFQVGIISGLPTVGWLYRDYKLVI